MCVNGRWLCSIVSELNRHLNHSVAWNLFNLVVQNMTKLFCCRRLHDFIFRLERLDVSERRNQFSHYFVCLSTDFLCSHALLCRSISAAVKNVHRFDVNLVSHSFTCRHCWNQIMSVLSCIFSKLNWISVIFSQWNFSHEFTTEMFSLWYLWFIIVDNEIFSDARKLLSSRQCSVAKGVMWASNDETY